MYVSEIRFRPCDDCPLANAEVQVDRDNTLELTDEGALIQRGDLHRYIPSAEIEYHHPELAETIKKCGGAVLSQCPAEPLIQSIQPEVHFPLPHSVAS